MGLQQRLEFPLRLVEPQYTEWQWPRAALAIFVLSLLLWGGIAAIVVFAFF